MEKERKMRKRSARISACCLAFALAAGALPDVPVRSVKAEGAKRADDLLEIRGDGGESAAMKLYANGVYEASQPCGG